MTIRFDDTDYRNTHGRAPKGYGAWAFSVVRTRYDVTDEDTVFWAPPGTFADARRAARDHFKTKYGPAANGVVYVCT